MEFSFNCEQMLCCDSQGFAVLEGTRQSAIRPSYLYYVQEILNSMGQLSAKVINIKYIKYTY